MTCNSDCPEYNDGHGTHACLRCPVFRYLLPRSQSVKYCQQLTQEVLENIADLRSKDPWSKVCDLSPEHAIILIGIHCLNLTQKDLARVLKVSQQQVSKLYGKALSALRLLHLQ